MIHRFFRLALVAIVALLSLPNSAEAADGFSPPRAGRYKGVFKISKSISGSAVLQKTSIPVVATCDAGGNFAVIFRDRPFDGATQWSTEFVNGSYTSSTNLRLFVTDADSWYDFVGKWTATSFRGTVNLNGRSGPVSGMMQTVWDFSLTRVGN